MSHLIRRTLSLLTVATLALGATAITLSPTQAAGRGNVIPDPALRECIASAMRNAGTDPQQADSISEEDLQSLLDAWSADTSNSGISCSGVASLEGLNVIAGLNHAEVFSTFSSQDGTITDVAPLARLTSLGWLELSYNQISDIAGLKALTNLHSLNLTSNKISDIADLAGLTALRSLSLDNNQVSDVTDLAGLTGLWSLSLAGNKISNILGLATLTGLNSLYLDNNQISDIAGLAKLANLQFLNLSNNLISKIADLVPLAALGELRMDNNLISDISDLSKLTALRYLSLSNNLINNIADLVLLADLQELILDSNLISNIADLANIKDLRVLSLGSNQVTDIADLAVLTDLMYLDVSGNQITDIAVLAGLGNLIELHLDENGITDISSLAGLGGLEVLHLPGNQVTDVSPLVGLTALAELNVANNRVADISSLAGLLNATQPLSAGAQPRSVPRLVQVSFNGNQITDLSSVARHGDGYVTAGDTPGLASEYAGIWGGFMGQTMPLQSAVAGTTVALPKVETASDSVYPIVWEVTSGDAVINADGTVTYSSEGLVQLAWSNPMPAISDDPSVVPVTTVIVSTFTGVASVSVAAAPVDPGAPSTSDSHADRNIVVTPTTDGAARLADGQDSYTIIATVASKDGTLLPGFAASLTAAVPPGVSVGAWSDHGDGTYSALVTSATPGNYVVGVALDGTTIGTIPVNFIAATISHTVRLLNEPQHAEGLGFLPGEEVQVTVYSDPIDLDRLTADGTGAIGVDFAIPAKFALGRHTVSFVGATSGRVVVAFEVVAASGGVSSSTGGVVLALKGAPVGCGLAFTCLLVAGFAVAMTRPRSTRVMR